MKLLILILLSVLFVSSANADIVVCLKNAPNWQPIMDNKMGDQGYGPAVIVNIEASRVTWIGSGGYIRLTGEQKSDGVMITRIDGRPTIETILSSKTVGNVTDLELEDSLGGTGLLRLTLDNEGNGSALWQHSTDMYSKENFTYCTKNVLNKF